MRSIYNGGSNRAKGEDVGAKEIGIEQQQQQQQNRARKRSEKAAKATSSIYLFSTQSIHKDVLKAPKK